MQSTVSTSFHRWVNIVLLLLLDSKRFSRNLTLTFSLASEQKNQWNVKPIFLGLPAKINLFAEPKIVNSIVDSNNRFSKGNYFTKRIKRQGDRGRFRQPKSALAAQRR